MQKRGWILALLIALPIVAAEFPATEEAVVAAFANPATVEIEADVDALVRMPIFEFTPTLRVKDYVETNLLIPGGGSGLIVHPDGYAVTNAHVLQADEFTFREYAIEAAMSPYYINWPQQAEQIRTFMQQELEVLGKTIKDVRVLVPIYDPVEGETVKAYAAEVRAKGEPYPGKDVAVLKLLSAQNLPTVAFTDTKHIEIGSRVISMGFPGAARLTEEEHEATVTAGIVSARKKTEAGWEVLQMDATIAPGSSGGPVFDRSGKVIGISTFAHDNRFFFLMPSEIIQEFLDEARVTPKRGVVDQAYERALNSFWSGRYENAINDFRIVQELNPLHPAAGPYIREARFEIESARAAGTPIRAVVLLIGIGLIVLVGILAIIAFREHEQLVKLRKG